MRRRDLLVGAAAAAAPGVAAAEAGVEVDMRLVLAVDVSRSVDADEYALQKDGYARAFTDPRVVDAISGGPLRRIGVCYVEWAGTQMQRTPLDWTLADGTRACADIAARIAELPYDAHRWTAVGAAMLYAGARLDASPFRSKRMVIDISGDGRNNNGPAADLARDQLVARGVTINGLPIMGDSPNFGSPPDRELDRWYEENVIGGPGAFVIAAQGYGDFARAVRQKLIREISALPSPVNRA